MEITQTITMPQAASTGSAGAAAAAPAAGGTADGGFLALVAHFMTPQPAVPQLPPEAGAAEEAGTTDQDAGTVPDGLLSLIAPGLFSNLAVPQRLPAEAGAATGGLSADAGMPAPPADASGTDPLPPALPGMVPMQPAQRPEPPVKGMAPQPGQDGRDADENAAAADADAQEGDSPLDEEVLAKLVEEGRAKLQAGPRPAPQAETKTLAGTGAQAETKTLAETRAQPQAEADAVLPKPEQDRGRTAPQVAGAIADVDAEAPPMVQAVRSPAPRDPAAQQPARTERQPETAPSPARETMVLQQQPERQAAPAVPATPAVPAVPAANRPEAAEAPLDAATADGAGFVAATPSDDAAGGDPMSEDADRGDGHGSRQAARQADRHERAAQQHAGGVPDAAPSAASGAETTDAAEARPVASPVAGPVANPADGGRPVGDRGVKDAGSFEEVLTAAGNGNAAPAEPEADPALAVQAPGRGPAESEAVDRAAPGHARSPMPHTPAEQVSVQIGKAAAGRIDQMVINLKPVELGNVEVKLDFGADGRVQASIRAERPETLEMLQKDQRTLERALADAGLRTDAGSLSFDLKGQGGNQRQFAGYTQPADRRGRNFGGIEEDLSLAAATPAQYKPGGASRSRLDIRI